LAYIPFLLKYITSPVYDLKHCFSINYAEALSQARMFVRLSAVITAQVKDTRTEKCITRMLLARSGKPSGPVRGPEQPPAF
jgi:hypothetical protein